MPSPPATVLTDQPDAPATPFPRLVAAMFSSTFGSFIALLTPLQLLLTLKVTSIAGHDAASAFGTITGLGALFALLANPLAGRISDRTAARFGRRRTWILTGSLAGSLVVFAMTFTTQVWQVAVIWCATQAVFNFQLAATSALLADQVPVTRRGTVSGITGIAATVGALVGIAAVSGISRPALQWGIVAAVSAALGVLAVILLRDPRHPRTAGRPGLSPLELMTSFWLNPWRHPAFGWSWLVRFLITCAYASGTYNALFAMDRFGVSAARVGGVVLVMSLLSVALLVMMSVIAGLVSDRLRRQKPFAIAAGVVAAGALLLMASASTLEEAYVASAVLGLGSGLLYSIDTAMCVRLLPSTENAGKDLGIINLANTLPQSLVPFIAPSLLSLGGFPSLYVTLAIFGIAGALAVLRLPEIGREGDRRWAAITRGAAGTDAATVTAAVN